MWSLMTTYSTHRNKTTVIEPTELHHLLGTPKPLNPTRLCPSLPLGGLFPGSLAALGTGIHARGRHDIESIFENIGL